MQSENEWGEQRQSFMLLSSTIARAQRVKQTALQREKTEEGDELFFQKFQSILLLDCDERGERRTEGNSELLCRFTRLFVEESLYVELSFTFLYSILPKRFSADVGLIEFRR